MKSVVKGISIFMEGTPPTVNHYWGFRGKYRFLTKTAIRFRKEVSKACKDYRIEGDMAVCIDYYPPDRRKRDIDNIIKPILDAMQHCGLFHDDYQVQQITATRQDTVVGGLVAVHIRTVA